MNCCAIGDIDNSSTDDLRINVGVKASRDPIPLCYSFGFDESHLREEILQTGNTTVPERISTLIRDGLCACDVFNPSGKCCLGEVNRTAKRLKKELSIVESCHKEAQKSQKEDAGDGTMSIACIC